MPPKRNTIDTERIVELYLEGASYRAIGLAVGCSKNTVLSHVNRYLAERKAERTDQVENEHQRVLVRLEKAANAAWQSYRDALENAAVEPLNAVGWANTAKGFLGEYRQAMTQYARLSGMATTERVEHTGANGGPITVEGPDPVEVLRLRLAAMSPQPLVAPLTGDGLG